MVNVCAVSLLAIKSIYYTLALTDTMQPSHSIEKDSDKNRLVPCLHPINDRDRLLVVHSRDFIGYVVLKIRAQFHGAAYHRILCLQRPVKSVYFYGPWQDISAEFHGKQCHKIGPRRHASRLASELPTKVKVESR